MISILYVDDETTLLDITRVFLERTGEFSVGICTSATEAISILATTAFDAIVSDYQMPGMDGIAFLKHLRSQGNEVPFILFTGKGREEVAIEALNNGADFYLQKGGEPKSQFAELTSKIKQAVQRRQAEQGQAASEAKYRDLVENLNDIIFTLDEEGRVTYISPRISDYGYTADELTGKHFSMLVHPDDLSRVQQRFTAIQTAELRPEEFQIVDKSGKYRFVRTSSRPVYQDGRYAGVRSVMTDITEQKTAQARISASEQQYRNVFAAAGDAMLVIDEESGRIFDANSSASYLFGFTVDDLKRMNHKDLLAGHGVPPEEERTVISGIPLVYYRNQEGAVFPADVMASQYPQKKRTISILSIRNLTVQKQAEERVLASQRLYAVLSQINQTIVHGKDLPALLSETCRISVEFGKFRMAWAGLFDRDSHTFRPVAHAGHEAGYLEAIESSLSDVERACGPTDRALHEGHNVICNDIETDSHFQPWRDEALKRGYFSSAAVPFRLHGEVVGAYILFASRKDAFNKAEIALLEEIARDISFALDMLDEQARRTHAEQALAGSEERARFLAEVLETSSQAFGVGYPGGGFGIVNPALCDLLGYTESELRSKTWLEITPPEFREAESAVLNELMRTGVPQRYEKEYFRKDGSRVPVEIFVHRVTDAQGNIRYLYGFITNITERREAEEEIRKERDKAQKYLDTAGVMLAVLDTDTTIRLINRKGCAILGYSEEELLGQQWLTTCLPERIRNDVQQVFDQVMHGDISLVEYHENPVLTKTGEERILAFHNTLLKDAGSRITGILFSGEDITPRKQVENALKESEERFRNLIQNSSDMIRILDRNGSIVYSSPSTLRITGYDPADITGKNPLEFVHPDDQDRVKGALYEVVEGTNPRVPTEYRIRHVDGHYIDVEAVATNLFSVPGIDGIVTTTRPITERRKAEQALRESEGRYHAIFEKSAEAIFVNGDTVIDCNPAAERMFGYSRGEILGKIPETFSPQEQPGNKPSSELVREYMLAARAGTPQSFNWVHCRKDGSLFPSRVTLMPARVLGELCIIGIVRDCSEKNRSDQRSRQLARLMERDPEPVIEVSRDREIRYANPAARAILLELGVPADPAAFLPEDFEELVIAIQAETTPSLYREVRIGTALFGTVLAFDPEESTIRIYAHDITTRVFEKSALEQANRKLNLLASIARHDIKNKLTGVMGYIELSRGATQDPELSDYLKRVELSANAIREQIEFTKTYENLGGKSPAWQEFSAVLNSAVTSLERRSVPVQNEVCDVEIYADLLLEKILTCLIENAQTHGKPLTKIRVHGSPSENGYLLVVEDDGVGIPGDQKEKIFNRKVGTGGTFGLFLAREILSITGITIRETGTPGKGARFEISVPSGKFHRKSAE
jgi:PAS domain S-box-containing protein